MVGMWDIACADIFDQYTKAFSGPHALKPLLIGVAVGFPLGFILRSRLPGFLYSDVIALGVATWTVAILSLWAVRIVSKTIDKPMPITQNLYHALFSPSVDPEWSQHELRRQYDSLISLPEKLHSHVDPESHLGSQVRLVLASCSSDRLANLAKQAFPSADSIMGQTDALFKGSTIKIELVSIVYMREAGAAMRAISCQSGGVIRVLVGCEKVGMSQQEIGHTDIHKLVYLLQKGYLIGAN
jgi:hypothetical protein